MPIIALGLRLKALMNRSFHLLDREAYRERPLSPVILINTLPVLLWREIISDGGIKVFYTVNIAEAGCCAGDGPFVFFNRCQIFSHSAGDIFPDRNLFNRPVLIDSGIFFKYLSVHLARALQPFTNAVVDRPMPAADKIAMKPSASSDLVKCFQP